jgi:A/G-specific adenine glycosylase
MPNLDAFPVDKPALRQALLRWYRAHRRDLPWRRTRDPYHVWISEIILQQTRVEQGTPYFERFVAAFPTIHDLAAASETKVLKLWEGLGYYRRARLLHQAAKHIVHQSNGELPVTADAWLAIPGVGRYTAGAIASIAFDEPAPVLDGNVKRVLARWLDIDDEIEQAVTLQRLWTVAETLVRGKHPGDFNQAMMELGARVCTPKAPQCAACPVARYCAAYAAGTQDQRPVRRAKQPVPHKEIVVAVIHRNGRYLLGKRPSDGLLGGLWEFPGGKINPGENHEQALLREVREELGMTVKPGGLVACVRHAYSHFRVTLNVYKCTPLNGAATAHTHTELRWVRKQDFHRYAFPKANHKFLGLL